MGQEIAELKKKLEENILDEQALAAAKEQHQVSETNYINALHRISHLEEALEGEMRSRLEKPLSPVHAQFVNANLARQLLDLRQNAIGEFGLGEVPGALAISPNPSATVIECC